MANDQNPGNYPGEKTAMKDPEIYVWPHPLTNSSDPPNAASCRRLMHAKQLRRVARSTKATKMAKEKKMPQEVGCSAKSKSVAWISKNHQTALVSLAEVKRLSINSGGIVVVYGALFLAGKEKSGNSWRITGTGWELNPPILGTAGSLLVAAVNRDSIASLCPNSWQLLGLLGSQFWELSLLVAARDSHHRVSLPNGNGNVTGVKVHENGCEGTKSP